jgi:flagellar basal-body rod modification protein FlgD
MAIDATTTAGAAAATAKIGAARASLATNFDTFLTLLTTQLKNQDPTSPLDTNQFTQQLTAMSGVEQQLLTNDLLKSMAAKASDGLTGAVGYIGKIVTADTAVTALADGKAAWTYDLDRTAGEVKLEVLNAAGSVVWAGAGQIKAGEHAFAWNGKDLAGTQLADGGRYTLRVTPSDPTGASFAASITTQGLVRAVEQSDGVPQLVVNGVSVPLTAVRAVRQSS